MADLVLGILGLRNKAIIVGSNGQDGKILTEYLRKKEYNLTLVNRATLDITNIEDVKKLVLEVKPHEIYFLPACHQSSEDITESEVTLFLKSYDVHVRAAMNFLESIVITVPEAKFFYASSSHIFPSSDGVKQNEKTLPKPQSIYAITKYSGMLVCNYYRVEKNIFASCGILFNHESNYRSEKYLSRKIVIGVTQILQKKSTKLFLGNLDVSVDWGYAPDYVDAIYRIMQLHKPSDYVIASGELHTVREFVEIAFNYVGLDYRNYVEVQSSVLHKRIEMRLGNATKLRQDTGWIATLSFKEMVELMIQTEMDGFLA